MKRFLRWVYDWITVLAASIVGLPTLLLQLLNYVGYVDMTPFVGSERALQIVCAIGIAKGVLAFLEGLLSKKAED